MTTERRQKIQYNRVKEKKKKKRKDKERKKGERKKERKRCGKMLSNMGIKMVGWLLGFYGISSFLGYLTLNLFS